MIINILFWLLLDLDMVFNIILHYSTQNPANIRSKSTIEAQEKGMKYVQN